jgi:hypothetical protein
VVFIIRKEFQQDFKEIIEARPSGRIETAYVYQQLEVFTDGFDIPEERTKPWRTANSVLCANHVVVCNPISAFRTYLNTPDFAGHDPRYF